MKRRIICFMLTLALLLSVIPAQAVFAKSDGAYGVSGKSTILKISSSKKTITVVPDRIGLELGDGYQVQICKDKKFKKGVKTYTSKDFATSYNKIAKKNSKNMKTDFNNPYMDKSGMPHLKISLSKQKKGTYYVRLRASFLNGHYTKWSKAKKIKVK